MILLYIHLGISALALVLFWSLVIDVAGEFKRRYPDRTSPKKTVIEHLATILRALAINAFPIINIAFACVYMFQWEEMKEKSIANIYEKSIPKEDEDNESN